MLRDGAVQDIPSVELVPGDLVIVDESEAFPADGLLVAGVNLQADESALTGEAMPVRKRPFKGTLGEGETSVDNEYWGAAGTRLLTGEARLRLVFTGGETLYGEIVRSAREGQHERTPLQSAISALVAGLVAIAVLVCVALAATRYYQGFGLLDAFLSAVTLAVAALPEEFPVAFTFFLGVGVYRLARRQALVRRAVVVENIGRVTCICSDKTGTITEGKLTLAHLLAGGRRSTPPSFGASRRSPRAPGAATRLMWRCSKARRLRPRLSLATFPFTEDRRRETSVVRERRRGFLAAAKGAPETIFAMSSLVARGEDRLARQDRGACRGRAQGPRLRQEEPQRLVRRRARPRLPSSSGCWLSRIRCATACREAVAKAQAAGIRVIMVTGDHVTTAAAIAREIGLGGETPRIIEGPQLKDLRLARARGVRRGGARNPVAEARPRARASMPQEKSSR